MMLHSPRAPTSALNLRPFQAPQNVSVALALTSNSSRNVIAATTSAGPPQINVTEVKDEPSDWKNQVTSQVRDNWTRIICSHLWSCFRRSMSSEERWHYCQSLETRLFNRARSKEDYEDMIRAELSEVNPSNYAWPFEIKVEILTGFLSCMSSSKRSTFCRSSWMVTLQAR